jgi:predicted permease
MNRSVETLVVSLEAVGNAAVFVGCGIFLERRGLMSDEGRRLLAEMSAKLTFPLLLFTNALMCEHDGQKGKCPELSKVLEGAWILLLWPFWIVGCGLFLGKQLARLSRYEQKFHRLSMAAVAFANSTVLPLTLINTVHESVPLTSPFAKTNPSIFVSIYLLVYTILMWSIGGWLLEPSGSPSSSPKKSRMEASVQPTPRSNFARHNGDQANYSSVLERERYDDYPNVGKLEVILEQPNVGVPSDVLGFDKICECCTIVGKQLFQPTIVASVLGIFVAWIPALRHVLVDIHRAKSHAPLGWLFDALHSVGQAAIPINMIMLGSTLSQGLSSIPDDFQWAPNLAIAFGRLVIVPAIAMLTLFCIDKVVVINEEIKSSLYFAMLVVTCTPTANNINVMVQIEGSNKEVLALCMLTQYVFAPLTLTLWVTAFEAYVLM